VSITLSWQQASNQPYPQPLIISWQQAGVEWQVNPLSLHWTQYGSATQQLPITLSWLQGGVLSTTHQVGISISIATSHQLGVSIPLQETHQVGVDYVLQTIHSVGMTYEMQMTHQIDVSYVLQQTHQLGVSYQQRLDTTHLLGCSIRDDERLQTAHQLSLSVMMTQVHELGVGYQQRLDTTHLLGCSIREVERLQIAHQLSLSVMMSRVHKVGVSYQQRLDITHPLGVSYPQRFDKSHFLGVTTYEDEMLDKTFSVAVTMSEPPVVVLSNECYIVHHYRKMPLLDLSLHTDTDSYAWSGSVLLAELLDYQNLVSGDIVTLYLQNTAYQLIATKPGYAKSGTSAPQLRLDLISVSAQLAEKRVTKSWGKITAHSLCEELAGEEIDWRIHDWTIPAGLAVCVNAVAIEYIRDIVAAVGAIVQTLPAGTLRVTYRCPHKPILWANREPDHTITSDRDILSISEQSTEYSFFNAIIVGDGTDDTEGQRDYHHDYEYDGEHTGTLRIWSNPWLPPENMRVLHTGHESLTIGTPHVKIVTEHETNVEFAAGEGNVKYGLYDLKTTTWNQRNLGQPMWSIDSQNLYAGDAGGYSLADVTYTRRVIEFPINFAIGTQTQFLVVEEYE